CLFSEDISFGFHRGDRLLLGLARLQGLVEASYGLPRSLRLTGRQPISRLGNDLAEYRLVGLPLFSELAPDVLIGVTPGIPHSLPVGANQAFVGVELLPNAIQIAANGPQLAGLAGGVGTLAHFGDTLHQLRLAVTRFGVGRLLLLVGARSKT